MSNLPRISIVTPSYNQSRYIEQTLRSVIEQDYPQLDYVIIDGGSTDGSVDVIKRYSNRIDYWVSEKDRGQAHAINKGFSHVSGDIMGWINSDDLLLPNALNTVGTLFARYPEIAWITGVGVNMNGDGKEIPTTTPFGYKRDWILRGWYHGRFLGFIRQESTFWRRSLWQKAGGYINETLYYGLDFDLWRRFAAYADLVFVHAQLGAYRVHQAQKTTELNRYYAEIGVKTPAEVRLITLPLRALLTLSASNVFPHIKLEKRNRAWRFFPGPLFRTGVL